LVRRAHLGSRAGVVTCELTAWRERFVRALAEE